MFDNPHGLDRREFLKRCACVGLGSAAFASTLGQWQIASAAAGDGSLFNDYRALVCVFLFGGNDAWNTIVPTGTTEHATYSTARGNLAIPVSQLLSISPDTAQSTSYGMHPSLTGLAGLFNSGRCAVVANVGALVQPTTQAQWQNRSVPLPPQLFSHRDMEIHWQTSRPLSLQRTGWLGRTADLVNSVNPNNGISQCISINGNNIMQTGTNVLPYSVSRNGVTTLRRIDDANATNTARKAVFEQLLNHNYTSVFAREFATIQTRAKTNAELLVTELANATALNTVFPSTRLGDQLSRVAQLIQIRSALNVQRQIYFVGLGGFDVHGSQNQRHPQLLTELDQAITAFYNSTVEMGIQNNVTTFTASEFGRTMTSNGDGSDHGWGGHGLVVGGCVDGKDIYGTMPPYEIGGPDDTRGGRLIPTTSVDQYGATLARWYGLTDSQVTQTFPNLSNFASNNLGFMM